MYTHKEVQEELRDPALNKVIDHYNLTGQLTQVMYTELSWLQQQVIQCQKRSFKRIMDKNE